MSTTIQNLDADFDMINWTLGGLESILNEEYDFHSMTGNESYYCYHYDVWSGLEAVTTESIKATMSSTTNKVSEGAKEISSQARAKARKYADSVKKIAQGLWKNLIDMLKRIREYFFGEGEEAAIAAAKEASEAVEAMNEMQGDVAVADDAQAKDPNVFMKALQGGVEFQELLKEHPALGQAIAKVEAASKKIGESKNISKLRQGYAELIKNANSGISEVTKVLRTQLSEAEKVVNNLKNPKTPGDGETPEVKESIKQENSQIINQAKEDTKKARLIGGVRNKLVAALNAISTQSKTVKDKLPQSKFKEKAA